jgi:hypothetical protein
LLYAQQLLQHSVVPALVALPALFSNYLPYSCFPTAGYPEMVLATTAAVVAALAV